MKTGWMVVCVAVTLLSGGSAVSASEVASAPPKQGFVLHAGLGLNLCLADGNASCRDVGPGISLTIAPGYRFSQLLSLSLDFQYGTHSLPDLEPGVTVSLGSLLIMPVLRAHQKVGSAEFMAAFGLGFFQRTMTASQGNVSFEQTFTTYLSLKSSIGYLFEVSQGIHIGPTIDYVSVFSVGELCVPLDGGGQACGELSGDVANQLTVGLFASMLL